MDNKRDSDGRVGCAPQNGMSHAGYLVIEVITSEERVGTVHCLATRLTSAQREQEVENGKRAADGGGDNAIQ